MVADSDGQTLTAVVICEGNLSDPDFPERLQELVDQLATLTSDPDQNDDEDDDDDDEYAEDDDDDDNGSDCRSLDSSLDCRSKNKKLKVAKVEPWNSVRVTLSIPREAAVKLRQLAAEGNEALKALGILSVQLEGDTVISLRLAGREIVLRTDNNASATATSLGDLSKILTPSKPSSTSSTAVVAAMNTTTTATATSTVPLINNNNITDPVPGSSKLSTPQSAPLQNGPVSSAIFKSPNTVCPMDGQLPTHIPKSESVEYPFESMTQARVIQRRENTLGQTPQFVAPTPPPAVPQQQPPPPPYPVQKAGQVPVVSMQQQQQQQQLQQGNNIAISSPLLVNLLQNEGANNGSSGTGGNGSPLKRKEMIEAGGNSKIVGNGSQVMVPGPGARNVLIKANSQQQNLVAQQKTIVLNNANANLNKQIPLTSSSIAGTSSMTQTVPSSSSTTPQLKMHQQQQPLSQNVAARFVTPPPNQTLTVQQQQQIIQQRTMQQMQQQQQQQQQVQGFIQHQMVRQRQPVIPQSPQQQTQQLGAYNVAAAAATTSQQSQQHHPRWTTKPMDSATKANFQEFTRYQMEYNLSQQQAAIHQNTQQYSMLHPHHQQQQQHQQSTGGGGDTLEIGALEDWTELSKNDLDSLLPSLTSNDLDVALSALDGKGNPLESLLDIDLMGSLETAATTNTSSASDTSNSSGLQPPLPLQTPLSQTAIVNGPSSTVASSSSLLSSTSSQRQPQVQFQDNNNKMQRPQMQQHSNNNKEQKRFLINPLTGDMEITQVDENAVDQATTTNSNLAMMGNDLPEMAKSIFSDDDDESSCGTNVSTKFPSDMSDTDKSNQSGISDVSSLLSNNKVGGGAKVGRKRKEKPLKEKTLKSRVNKVKKVITPVLSPAGAAGGIGVTQELKLRLKLETIAQSPKKPIASKPAAAAIQQYNFTEQDAASPGEELRVPPLHISIKNKSVVIKNTTSGSSTGVSQHKKDKKRFQDDTDDDAVRLKKKASSEDHQSVTTGTIDDSKSSSSSSINNEVMSSPNGLISSPEKQRRPSGVLNHQTNNTTELNSTTAEQLQTTTQHSTTIIGSTNVGTLPQHSSFSSSKSSSNLRPSSAAGTSLLVVTTSSSSQQQQSQQHKNTLKALLQQNSDIISEEKFKQKLLENTDLAGGGSGVEKRQPTGGGTVTVTAANSSSSNKVSNNSGSGGDRTMETAASSTTFHEVVNDNCSNNEQRTSEPVTTTTRKETELNENQSGAGSGKSSVTQVVTTTSTSTTVAVAVTTAPSSAVSKNTSAVVSATTVRQPESSPKRDNIGGVLIDPTIMMGPSVRNSPGSQAQGEDSGIESMDALSEKSPHQNSHSPQGVTVTNDNIRTNSLTNAVVVDNQSGTTTTTNTVATATTVVSTNNKKTIDNRDGQQQQQGSTTTSSNNKTSTNNNKKLVEFYGTNDIEAALAHMEGLDEMMETLEKDSKLNGGNDHGISKSTLLEDLVASTSELELKTEPIVVLDKYEFHDSPMLEELKDLNENKEQQMNLIKGTGDDVITTTVKTKDVKLDEPFPVRTTPALYTYSVNDKLPRSDLDSASGGSSSDSTTTVTIQAATTTPSKETQATATNKDVLTQLSIEIPQHSENENATRIRTRASSKLESPLEPPKQSPSEHHKPLSKLAVDRLSPKGALKGKRKRAGSESSNQSCVSDDQPGKTKKVKKSDTITTPLQVNNDSAKTPNLKGRVGRPPNSYKRSECSSDSDEPLIEVAGKVRNSKLIRSSISSSTSSLDSEKVLRNHRIVNATSIVVNTTPHKAATGHANAVATTPAKINLNDEKISTRRSVRMTNSTLSTHAQNKAKAASTPTLTTIAQGEVKMKAGNGNTTTATTTSNTTNENQEAAARRKTRSAGLDGTTASEGRRRRGSRDGK